MTFSIARTIPSRTKDPKTSHDAYEKIKVRAGSQRAIILASYERGALTDEEAAERAEVGIMSCWWKRCSELREGGYIKPTGETRRGSQGADRMVCRLTMKGQMALERMRG